MSPITKRNRIALAALAAFAAAATIAAPTVDGEGDQTLARKAGGTQQEYIVITSP